MAFPLPPWLQIGPGLFTQALEAGARTGLAVSEQQQRVQQLAEARAERAAQQAERAAEFDATRLLNVQRLAQDAAQLQQQQRHQTAQEVAQAAQESRLLNYDTGRLAVENRRATALEKQASTPPTLVPDATGRSQGYLLDSRGIPHFVPAPPLASLPPQDRTVKSVRDEAGNIIANDVGGNRVIPVARNEQEVTALRARASLLEQQYMINNPPKGSAEEKRIQDALLAIDNRLEQLTTGKTNAPTVVAPKGVGLTGRINPLPSSKADLEAGKLYDTKRGIARWNGTAFEKVP
jgi:hypothetical protein